MSTTIADQPLIKAEANTFVMSNVVRADLLRCILFIMRFMGSKGKIVSLLGEDVYEETEFKEKNNVLQ